jgi:hypothetical protein
MVEQTETIRLKPSDVAHLYLKMRLEVGDERFRQFLIDNLIDIPCCTETIQ